MKTVYQILESLRSTTKGKEKLAIMQSERDNAELKQFFILASDPKIKFYQKQRFDLTGASTPSMSLSVAMDKLVEVIASRHITGNAAREFVQSMMNCLSVEDCSVLQNILSKKPDCGVESGTLDKIWPGILPDAPFLLASPWSEKLASKLNWVEGCIAQLKSDGLRVAAICDTDVTMITRGNNEIMTHGCFDFMIKHFDGFVIDGEVVAIDSNGKYIDRKTSNGIVNKAVKGTISKEEAASLCFIVWDIIPIDDYKRGQCSQVYESRFRRLVELTPTHLHNWIHVSPTKVVHSINECQAFYTQMIAEGHEGAMVKSKQMMWADERSKLQLKMKSEKTLDMKVTAWIEGNKGTKYEGMLGAVTCETSDGLIEVNVGSGFSDEDRQMKPEDIVGKIIEVKYNQTIVSKAVGAKTCLFLPRVVCIRHDKTMASTSKEA
jgi:ATP dependent DNA ligase domain/DNA ligase OB-like domain